MKKIKFGFWENLIFVCLAIILTLRLIPSEYIPKIIFSNISSSLPYHIYLRIPNIYTAAGDYVVYIPPKEVKDIAASRGWMKEETFFLKEIGGVAGDSYYISKDLNFYINGKYVGKVSATDKENRPMPFNPGLNIIPEDSFMPIGTNPKSFDGRYTGAVSNKAIIAKVIPIF